MDYTSESKSFVIALAIGFITFYGLLFIHRAYLDPLASLPGPKIAGATYWWLAYHECWRDGQFIHYLPELHEKYGPVVRVSPSEVHIHEPSLYHHIYKQKTRFHKDPRNYNGFGFPNSSFTMVDPERHRARRALLEPRFSKSAVAQYEDYVYSKVDGLCHKIESYSQRDESINIQSGFLSIAVDIISGFAFGQSFATLDFPGFTERKVEEVLSFTRNFWLIIHFPSILYFILRLPRFLGRHFARDAIRNIALCEQIVNSNLSTLAAGKQPPKDSNIFETVFNTLVSADPRPPYADLVDEAFNMLTAGTDSSGAILNFGLWYFLTASREIQSQVLAELDSVPTTAGQQMRLNDLEKLPYFTGFIQECLRCISPVPGKLPRLVPGPEGLTVPSTGHHIRPGAIVSMSHVMIHRDPHVFVDPWKFAPERWIGKEGRELEKNWLMAFSHGTRRCIGKQLAYMEMYLIWGHMFRRFEMIPWETSKEDMSWVDHGAAHNKGVLKIKARVRKTDGGMAK